MTFQATCRHAEGRQVYTDPEEWEAHMRSEHAEQVRRREAAGRKDSAARIRPWPRKAGRKKHTPKPLGAGQRVAWAEDDREVTGVVWCAAPGRGNAWVLPDHDPARALVVAEQDMRPLGGM